MGEEAQVDDIASRLAARFLAGHLRREELLGARTASAPPPATAELAVGRRFGRYEVERLLGSGAMGLAYLARQVDLDRHVVLKVLAGEDASPERIERLHREARAMAQVASDHVVKVFEVGTLEGVPFIAMEYVDGLALDVQLQGGRALPFEEATRIAIEAARGLVAAHEAGILHRDVKPGNVLLTRAGRVKVADFGLAKAAEPANVSISGVGTVVGTPDYMAPEQAEGIADLDGRADVYALGATYYHLLTGRAPFAGRSAIDVLSQKLAKDCVPPRQLVPEIPPAIDRVATALLARSREERPSMKEALAELESALAESSDRAAARFASRAVPDLTPSVLAVGPSPTDSTRSTGGPKVGATLAVPGRFGPYAIERLLGRGGMGTTYLARQDGLDRAVVVKVMNPEAALDPETVERFRREAKAAAQVVSDNAVKIYDAGLEGGIAFLSMEYVDGVPATALLGKHGPCSPLEATRIVLAAARGLRAAHEVGVLHRDVKPANILMARDGRVKIADFGLAKIAPPSGEKNAGKSTALNLTMPGTILGTLAYMAPEQIRGEATDARSDVYSLGVTFYELLTAKLPWPGSSPLELLAARARPPVSPRSHVAAVSGAVERACLAFMNEDPARRPASMAVVVQTLERLARSLEPSDPGGRRRSGVAARSSTRHATPKTAPPAAKPTWWLAVAGAAVVLLGVVAGVVSSPGEPAREPTPVALAAPELAPAPPVEAPPPPPAAPPPRVERPAPAPPPAPPEKTDDDLRQESLEREASLALDAARRLPPTESLSQLDLILAKYHGTRAALTASVESVLVKRIVDELAAARDGVALALERRDPGSAGRLVEALAETLTSKDAPNLERITEIAGVDDPRLTGAAAWIEATRAAVARARAFEQAIVLGLVELREACLAWRTKPAAKTLATLEELDAKDPRITAFAAALASVETMRRVAHAPPDTREKVAQVAGDLDRSHAGLDDATRLAVQVVAAYLGQGLPKAFGLETAAGSAQLAAILDLTGCDPPPLRETPRPPPPDDRGPPPDPPEQPPSPPDRPPPGTRPPPGPGGGPPPRGR